MINEILQQLGFNQKQIAIYLAILENGKILPSNLAKITGINRTTVYAVTKELINKGVVIEDLAGKTAYLVALPPSNLSTLAQREERELQNKKILIDQAIGELQELSKNTKYSVPKITFIYEQDLEDFLYKQSPIWNESILKTDGIWWGFQDPSFVESYQKWIDWYWKKSVPKTLKLQLLTNLSDIEKKMVNADFQQRVMKFWNNNDFTASTWINGDYLVLIQTQKKPFYLVQIHDKLMAYNMREIFKAIWKTV